MQGVPTRCAKNHAHQKNRHLILFSYAELRTILILKGNCMSDKPDLRGLNEFVGQKYDEIVDQMYSWLEENFDDISEYNDWEKSLGEDVSQLTDFG